MFAQRNLISDVLITYILHAKSTGDFRLTFDLGRLAIAQSKDGNFTFSYRVSFRITFNGLIRIT